MEETLEELADKVAASVGCELVSASEGRSKAGVLITAVCDRRGGRVTVDDLSEINRFLRAKLEATGRYPQGFRLQVISPGLDRPLLRDRDWQCCVGRLAVVKLKGSGGRLGRVRSCEGEDVLLELKEGGEAIRFRLVEVESARLEPEIDFSSKEREE